MQMNFLDYRTNEIISGLGSTKLKFERLEFSVPKIDTKLPKSGRLLPQQCITINKEKFFTTEANLHEDSPFRLSRTGMGGQLGRDTNPPGFTEIIFYQVN
jgi:hypothetical protein